MTSVYFSMGYSSIDIKLSASKFNVNYQNKLWHQLLHYVSQQIRSIQSKVYRGTFRSILQHFLVLYLSLNSKTFHHSDYKPMSCIPKYGNMMVFKVFHSQWWHNSPTNFRFLWVPPHRHTWARKAGGNGYVFAHNSHAHMSVVWSPDCEQQFHLSTHLQSTFARLPQGQTIHYGLCKYSGILTLVNSLWTGYKPFSSKKHFFPKSTWPRAQKNHREKNCSCQIKQMTAIECQVWETHGYTDKKMWWDLKFVYEIFVRIEQLIVICFQNCPILSNYALTFHMIQ